MLKTFFYSPANKFFLPLVFFRLALGLFFFASGFNKLFIVENQQLMLQTITEAGIPFPAVMAVFVAFCETLFGLLLASGLLTRLSALVLMIISTVALLTVGIYQIPSGINAMTWYSWLYYLPESSYILIALNLMIQGSGPYGLDQWIYRRLYRPDSRPALLPGGDLHT
ncbi:MAG: Putative inner membrane protein [Candidatus Tokpelaia hoelldobleri]|uniref:Inner membrane protein n=1 Tax=Candidatus Tokpelaia hoelldobleri TaxID=1902579 RepID=A0A1U9JWM9_9HYPH|nr:MAG: Putative inner membrane protein [Candidatus Tokpelaia hoelldoblerii]